MIVSPKVSSMLQVHSCTIESRSFIATLYSAKVYFHIVVQPRYIDVEIEESVEPGQQTEDIIPSNARAIRLESITISMN